MRGVSPFIATIILVVTTLVVYSVLSSYIRGAGTGGVEVQKKLQEELAILILRKNL